MGNQANCNKFCNPNPPSQVFKDDLMVNDYILQCQICNRQIKHNNFKEHLDLFHYAAIKQVEQNIEVSCLLCDHHAASLDIHGQHLQNKHQYAWNAQKIRFQREEIQTSSVSVAEQQSKKNTMHLLNKDLKNYSQQIMRAQDFQILRKLENGVVLASYDQEVFQVIKNQKEYTGMEYDQSMARAEMLWFPVFQYCQNQRKKIKFYFFDCEPKTKTIKCTSLLFAKHQ